MEKTIEELQKEKLELEIKEFNRAWYKRRDYLQVLLPTTLAIFSLFYAVATGLFNAKYDLYQLKEQHLKDSVVQFAKTKRQLIIGNDSLRNVQSKFRDSILLIKRNYSKNNFEMKLIKDSIKYWQAENKRIRKEVHDRAFRIIDIYEKGNDALDSIDKISKERQDHYFNELRAERNSLASENNSLNAKVKMLEKEIYELRLKSNN